MSFKPADNEFWHLRQYFSTEDNFIHVTHMQHINHAAQV